ncbi:uncharacterized protein LOC125483108 [Rhincodon typus]|uniref:uncharacterized protein LOC125483108 n=1 Tax=Rhincodon typus TaxID=259920 RepID=UPI00202F400E|nr:uncharacterized protein LOC125483108 [Rhincodon typus]
MKNRTIAGFSVTKCSAFQFLKNRVRKWIRSAKVNVDKHQHTHLNKSDAFVKATPQKDADPQLRCQSTCQECHVSQVMAIKVGTRANSRNFKVRRWKKSDRFKPDELLPIKTDKSDSCASQTGKVPKLAAQPAMIECHCCLTNITHKPDESSQARKNSKIDAQSGISDANAHFWDGFPWELTGKDFDVATVWIAELVDHDSNPTKQNSGLAAAVPF